MQRFLRVLLHGTSLFLLVGAFVNSAPAQAAPATYLVVDTLGNNCLTSQPTPYSDIQSAVNAAKTGGIHTIKICPGTYVAGQLTLDGIASLTLTAAFPDEEPVLTPGLGQTGGWIIEVTNLSTGIVIDHLVLDGTNFDDTSINAIMGILIHDSSVTIQNTALKHIRQPIPIAAYARAIVINDTNKDGKTSTVKLTHNYIGDIQEMAVSVNGQVKLTMLDNFIDTNSSGVDYVGDGIILTGDSTGIPSGSITKNVISGTAGKAIQLVEVGKITITGNTIQGGHYGVMIQSQCQVYPGASGSKISGNTIQGFDEGVYLFANASTGVSTSCNPQIDGTSITSNILMSSGPDAGDAVLVVSEYLSGLYVPEVSGTIVTKNQMTGFNSPYSTTTAGGGTATAKTISGNQVLP